MLSMSKFIISYTFSTKCRYTSYMAIESYKKYLYYILGENEKNKYIYSIPLKKWNWSVSVSYSTNTLMHAEEF